MTDILAKKEKVYTPNDHFVKHLEKLRLHQKSYLEKSKTNVPLSAKEKRERRRIQRITSYYMTNYIFKALEDIITFFEWSKLPELQPVFAEGVAKLFTGGNISRLIHAPLDTNLFKDQDNGHDEVFNRRLAQIAALMVMEGTKIFIEYYKQTHQKEPEIAIRKITDPIEDASALCKALVHWERVTSSSTIKYNVKR